jgi:hypothetical protein
MDGFTLQAVTLDSWMPWEAMGDIFNIEAEG